MVRDNFGFGRVCQGFGTMTGANSPRRAPKYVRTDREINLKKIENFKFVQRSLQT